MQNLLYQLFKFLLKNTAHGLKAYLSILLSLSAGIATTYFQVSNLDRQKKYLKGVLN